MIERLSIEFTNRCAKACDFCYNHSLPGGDTRWTPDELVAFARDCAGNGVRAVSFGGGEPLQYDGLFDVLERLRGVMFRSVTTNGLMLSNGTLDRLVASAPDKVHVSIHFPERDAEVRRVIGTPLPDPPASRPSASRTRSASGRSSGCRRGSTTKRANGCAKTGSG